MAYKRIPLEADRIYHIYNHAVGSDNLFARKENYRFFLERYAYYLYDYLETYCYCLLPNHYHVLARVRPEEVLVKKWQSRLDKGKTLAELLAHQVGNFQNSYAKSFNKQQNRRGSLFCQSFGRKPVDDASYFSRVVHYIHANAVHHGFVRSLEDWPYSSFHAYNDSRPSKLDRQTVFSWYGGAAAFFDFHRQMSIDERLALEFEDFR